MLQRVSKPADNLSPCVRCASDQLGSPLPSRTLEQNKDKTLDQDLDGEKMHRTRETSTDNHQSPVVDDSVETVATVHHGCKENREEDPARTPTRVQKGTFGDDDNVSPNDASSNRTHNSRKDADSNCDDTIYDAKEDHARVTLLLKKYESFWKTPKGRKVHIQGCPVLKDRPKSLQNMNSNIELVEPCRYCLNNMMLELETIRFSKHPEVNE